MREMIISELSQALHELARDFAHFLPRLIVMLILALVGWMIAYLAKWLCAAFCGSSISTNFRKMPAPRNCSARPRLPSATEMLSRFVFWVTWLGFILLGVSALGILGLQQQIARFFFFLPRLFVAMFIMFFGLLAASFFSRAALLAAVNANVPSPRVLESCSPQHHHCLRVVGRF